MTAAILELPHVVSADVPGQALSELTSAHRPMLRARLATHGAVLLRGFQPAGTDGLRRFAEDFSGEPATGVLRALLPAHLDRRRGLHLHRLPAGPGDLPAQRELLPVLLAPHALLPVPGAPDDPRRHPAGRHPPVSTRSLDPAVREEFERRGWSVVRNFHPGFGVPWTARLRHRRPDEPSQTTAAATRSRSSGSARGSSGPGPCAARYARTPTPASRCGSTTSPSSTTPRSPRRSARASSCCFPLEDLPCNTYYGDGGAIPDASGRAPARLLPPGPGALRLAGRRRPADRQHAGGPRPGAVHRPAPHRRRHDRRLPAASAVARRPATPRFVSLALPP